MTGTTTPRLSLYKPDTLDLVNVLTDLNNNLVKLDASASFLPCTSSTRPSAPFAGQSIRETDTGRMWVSNGSAPASGSWIELCTPGTAQTFTSSITVLGASSTNVVEALAVVGDTNRRLGLRADGRLSWGTGSTTEDTFLYRSGVNALTTDGKLTVAGDLAVGGVGKEIFLRKTADTNSTSTTAADDPHLTTSVTASQVYELSGRLYIQTTDTANADIGLSFTAPASTGGWWDAYGQNQTSTTDSTAVRTIATAFGAGARTFGAISGSVMPIILAGLVRPTATGTFALNFNRAGASGTVTVSADSYMRLSRVA